MTFVLELIPLLKEILRAGKTFLLLHSNILLAWVRKLPLSAWTSDVHALAAQWPVTKKNLSLAMCKLNLNLPGGSWKFDGNFHVVSPVMFFFSTQVFQSQKLWFDARNVVQKTQATKPHLGLISEFIFIFVPQQTPDIFFPSEKHREKTQPLWSLVLSGSFSR